MRRGALGQRDHAGINDAHVSNVNAERIGDHFALDAVGAGKHAQERLPGQVGQRRSEAIVEAALLGHDAGQIEELPSRGRDAAVFVANGAANHREQHVRDVEHSIALHRAEAASFEQQRVAIKQTREDGGERGSYGGAFESCRAGMRTVRCDACRSLGHGEARRRQRCGIERLVELNDDIDRRPYVCRSIIE